MVTNPAPPELGRGVVVSPGCDPPDPWARYPRVAVGPDELARPGPVLDVLHQRWLARQPVVVELGVDPNVLKAPERWDGPVYDLTPGFEFGVERLHFLVWANNYDARAGAPVWWHGRKAARAAAARGWSRAARPTSPWPTGRPCSSTAAPRIRRPWPPGWASSTAGARRRAG